MQSKLRQVHLWLGLIAGLFIVMMGLTGLVIVFRSTIESAATPKVISGEGRSAVPAMNLTLVQQTLATAHPGARITRITFPQSSAEPVLVQSAVPDQPRVQEFFDGSSGQYLGPKAKLAWLDWIAELHQNLLLEKTGRALTGIIGLALLLLGVSGLLSWLSGQRDWKCTLAVPQTGPWRRLSYQGHKWAGLWANLFLITASATGIVLAYPDTFQQAIRAISGETPPSKVATRMEPRDGGQGLPALDEYVRVAAASVPGGVVRELRLPNRRNLLVSVAMWAPGDPRPKGGTMVLLDPFSARVLSVERSSGWFSSQGLVAWANAIHKTELGGFPVKLGWAFFGLTPLLLFVSGLQIWWTQRTAARRAQRNAQMQEAAKAATMLVSK